MKEHAPLPWVELADGFIASLPMREKREINNVVAEAFTIANQKFIVRVVNAHNELVEAAKKVIQSYEYEDRKDHEDWRVQQLKSAVEKSEAQS